MTTTPNENWPLIAASQAQKHVTHNDALMQIDARISTWVRSNFTFPTVDAAGNLAVASSFVVPAPFSGTSDSVTSISGGSDGTLLVITGTAGNTLTFVDGGNLKLTAGNRILDQFDDTLTLVRRGTDWLEIGGEGAGGAGVTDGDKGDIVVSGSGAIWTVDSAANLVANRLGLGGATPDATNRLSTNSPATLLNHAGAGHEVTVNKNAAGNDAAFAFKVGFSVRALFGLLGDNDFHIKVSPDGSTFVEALVINQTSGAVKIGTILNIKPNAGDPAGVVDGDIWYNSTTGKFRARQAGVTVDMI